MKVPENVRRHNQLIKEAQTMLESKISKYVVQKVSDLTPVFKQFRNTVQSIPDTYVAGDIKLKLIRNKELVLLRTVQAKVLEKTTNEWLQSNMIRMVIDDKRIKKLKEK